jgi:outer membrane protein OmpA-like peptidoglycan-associated protein
MTKPLEPHLSRREAPQPRAARRPRTWLVALLGFGAADLLVLNLWAVPQLITNPTTTDMRAAHSGDLQAAALEADPQPQAAVPAQAGDRSHESQAAQGAMAADQGDAPTQLALQRQAPDQQAPRAEPSHPSSPAQRGARPAQPSEAPQAAQQHEAAQQADHAAQRGAAQGDYAAQRGAAQGDYAAQRGVAQQGELAAQQRSAAAQREDAQQSGSATPPGASAQQRGSGAQPGASTQQGEYGAQPGASAQQGGLTAQRAAAQQGDEPGASTQHGEHVADGTSARQGALAAPQSGAQQGASASAAQQGENAAQGAAAEQGASTQLAAAAQAQATGAERASSATRDDWATRAPRAEAPPGGAPPPKEDSDVVSDPAVARAFAIRAARRAVRIALQDRTKFSANGPFDALTVADQPLTQIFFSLGNFALGPNGKQLLERKLPLLNSDQRPILIIGAADPSGPEQVNEKLSDARAQSVAEWLLLHGVDAQRIHTHAIGHEGAVGSTLDRRVDIWLGGSR